MKPIEDMARKESTIYSNIKDTCKVCNVYLHQLSKGTMDISLAYNWSVESKISNQTESPQNIDFYHDVK